VVCSGTQPPEASVIESDAGTVIVLVNWSGEPQENIQVQVNIPVPTGQVSLASGGNVSVDRRGLQTVFSLDLDVADVLILR
jgi:hypothetical protein